MSVPFNESDFREMVRQALTEARTSAQSVVLHEDPLDSVQDIVSLLESGDEFGDVFGDVGWKDLTRVAGDPGKVKDALVGSALKIGVKAKTLLSVIIRGIPSLVIPFIKTNYERIHANERAQMSRIKQKYPDVFKHAGQLFTDDAKMVAFMINPVLMTAAVAAQGAADSVLGLADALGRGDPEISGQIKRVWRHVNRVPGQQRQPPQGKPAAKGNEDLYYQEGVVLEATDVQRLAAKLLRNPDFQKRLASTKVTHAVKADAERVKNETLNNLITFANQVRQIEDIEALRKIDSGIAQKVENQVQKLDQGEAESVIQTAIKEIKDASIEALVGKMKIDIEMLQQLKIPEKSELIAAYQKALSRIVDPSSKN